LVLTALPIVGGASLAADRPDLGGPFDLASSKGGRFTEADLKGRPHAILFGFTYCPDICPTALSGMATVMQELGPAADELRVLFITVDPERDTPELLASYLPAFDERFVGLSGTPEETATAARAFKAVYRKAPLPDGNYVMDHTALVYLLDRHGRFFGTLDYRDDHAKQVTAVRRVLQAP
jgi:protein SCO1/2